MATNANTWQSEHVGAFLDLARKAKSKKGLLYELYFHVLEHDSATAKQLADEVSDEELAKLVHTLKNFQASYSALQAVLLRVTKNSEKF